LYDVTRAGNDEVSGVEILELFPFPVSGASSSVNVLFEALMTGSTGVTPASILPVVNGVTNALFSLSSSPIQSFAEPAWKRT